MINETIDLQAFMDEVRERNPGETEFHQAVREVAEDIKQNVKNCICSMIWDVF